MIDLFRELLGNFPLWRGRAALRALECGFSGSSLEISFESALPFESISIRLGRAEVLRAPFERRGEKLSAMAPLSDLPDGQFELQLVLEGGKMLPLREPPVGPFALPLRANIAEAAGATSDGAIRSMRLVRSPTNQKLSLQLCDPAIPEGPLTSALLTFTARSPEQLFVFGVAVSLGAPEDVASLALWGRKGTNVDQRFVLGALYRVGTFSLVGRTCVPFVGRVDVGRLHEQGAFSERQCHVELGVHDAEGRASYPSIRAFGGKRYARLRGEVLHSFRRSRWPKDVCASLKRDGALTLLLRTPVPEDRWPFRLKELAALAVFTLSGRRIRDSWIMYEAFSNTAQDNAFVLFEWLKAQRVPHDVYYVLRKDSPQTERLAPYADSVLEYGSFRHLLEMLRCEAFVSSQGRDHCYVFRALPGPYKRHILNKPLVFLQHGVTAFKKSNFRKSLRSPTRADLVIAVSHQEKDIIREHWGYSDDEIAVTGFPRFDVLEDKSTKRSPAEVLVMPTWRSWLSDLGPGDFKASEFFTRYQALLDSKELHSLLESEDAVLSFFGHVRIGEQSQTFVAKHPRIRLVPTGNVPVNELLMRAKVLVTDYSSVAWDFHYMRKPVVFYRFDIDKYLLAHGSHVDLRAPSFGAFADELPSFIEQLRASLESEADVRVSQSAFEFNDRANCQRTYDAILRVRSSLRR